MRHWHKTTRRHNPEDHNPNFQLRESHILTDFSVREKRAAHVALSSGKIQWRNFCNHDNKKSSSVKAGYL
jgi:hypothetical protein